MLVLILYCIAYSVVKKLLTIYTTKYQLNLLFEGGGILYFSKIYFEMKKHMIIFNQKKIICDFEKKIKF
jgi:hypothetical protein